MNKTERLILENQKTIMFALGFHIDNKTVNDSVAYQMRETEEALNPKQNPLPYAESLVDTQLHKNTEVENGNK